MLSQELIQQIQSQNLSLNDKMDLVAMILGVEPDKDNHGQLLFYTGICEDKDGVLKEFEGYPEAPENF